MTTGFDHPGPTRFRHISTERAIVELTRHQVQAVEIDHDNPRALRFLLSGNQTLKMEPVAGKFRFTLSAR